MKEWNCDVCDLCKGESKGFYYFDKDLAKSINSVQEVSNDILQNTNLTPRPTDVEKRGDILLYNKDGKKVARVEVKLITTTFRKIKTILPNGDLTPYETVVIDEPKLKTYFKTQEEEGIPFFVVVKLTRACRDGAKVFARLEDLKSVYDLYGRTRYFQRQIGAGDGNKGIIAKYHFSIDREFNTDYPQLFQALNHL